MLSHWQGRPRLPSLFRPVRPPWSAESHAEPGRDGGSGPWVCHHPPGHRQLSVEPRPSGRGFHGSSGTPSETATEGRLLLPPELPDPAATQVELALGPGDADEEAAAVPLPVAVIIVGSRVRKKSLFQSHMKTTGNSRPLAACNVIRVPRRFPDPSGRSARPA